MHKAQSEYHQPGVAAVEAKNVARIRKEGTGRTIQYES